MKSYTTRSIVTNKRQIVLSESPFDVGETVEVTVRSADALERSGRVSRLKQLFRETQALDSIRSLTDDEIMSELKAYRSGQ